MGLALGRIGLSRADFEALTYEEFEAVAEAHRQAAEERERGAWERARTVAAIVIQPHVRRRLTPAQLLPLSWDKARPSAATDAPTAAPDLTPGERRRRFEALAAGL